MTRLYMYRIKTILGDKGNMFWTLVFPLLMATLFFFSFGQMLDSGSRPDPVPVAVVGEDATFTQVLDGLSGEGNDSLLDVTYTDEAQAEALLEEEAVDGILHVGETLSLTVKNEGLNQSILKNVVDSYVQITSTVTNIAQRDHTLVEQVVARLQNPDTVVEHVSISGNSNANFLQDNFYSLIAMTCLYGSFFGLTGALKLQPGLSPLGTRRNITPTPKLSLILSDMLAAVTMMMGIVIVLLLYMRFALGIGFGASTPAILLTVLAGVFVGVMLGMFVGVAFRARSGVKDGILVGLVLALCFFSGLMYPGMRFLVEQYAPFFNRINPAALITDAFYALDVYGVGGRFWTDIAVLAVIGALLCACSAVSLRRKQYASL